MRNEKFGVTATDKGIPIGSPHYDYSRMGAICMLPVYNVERETLEDYPQDRIWHIKCSELLETRNKMAPNFIYLPIECNLLLKAPILGYGIRQRVWF